MKIDEPLQKCTTLYEIKRKLIKQKAVPILGYLNAFVPRSMKLNKM